MFFSVKCNWRASLKVSRRGLIDSSTNYVLSQSPIP